MKQKLHKKILLSVIIPAYKQERTIVEDLQVIKKTMDSISQPYEIIVVVDGKIDKTFQNAKKVQSAKIKIIGYEHNRGKGYAIRYGVAHAKGDLIAFLDAGMDLKPEGIIVLLSIMENKDADIVVGSKLHPLSHVKYPFQRKILSIGYRTLVKLLFGLSISDTQVGMKLFKKNVLRDVFPRLLVKAFAFDIEILAVANNLGYKRIYEAPIELKFKNFSSITSKSFLRVVGSMLWDTLAVFYRLHILHYYASGNKRKWKYDEELSLKINIP